MEKLNKIIAGLECCCEDDRCLSCPYKDVGHPGDLDCIKVLAEDALNLLKDMKIAVTAAGVLERYRPAFEELAKGEE